MYVLGIAVGKFIEQFGTRPQSIHVNPTTANDYEIADLDQVANLTLVQDVAVEPDVVRVE